MLDRGRFYYTQSSEGKTRWTRAVNTVQGHTMTLRITDSGGQGPSGAKERTGEVYTFGWSRYRDQLTLTPVAREDLARAFQGQTVEAHRRGALSPGFSRWGSPRSTGCRSPVGSPR